MEDAPEITAPADAPIAEPADAPVIETPVAVEPEPVVPAVEEPVVETPAVDDPYAEYGGKDNVAAAHRLYEASRTEDGVIQLFLEAGRSLGLGLKEMQGLFDGLTPASSEPATPEIDPDEPLTYGQWQELERQRQEQAAQANATAAQAAARTAVQSALTDLKLDQADPATKIILGLGDKYVNGDFSRENVLNAVRRGQAEYTALLEQQAQAYITKKHAQAQGVPSAPSGAAAPSDPPPAEPQSVAEAIKAVRQKLGLSS